MNNRNKYLAVIFFLIIASGSLCFQENAIPAPIPIERIVLSNKLVVLISEDHSLPLVTCMVLVDAGAWRDPEGKGGLANLTTEGILLGTSQYSFDEINEKTDSMGSEIDVSCGRDFAVLSMKSLKKNLEPTLDIFIDVLINPIFPESEIERKKAIILGQIQSRKDNPKEVAENHFREKLFLTFPFGHPLEGTEESIPKLDRIAVLRFHQSFWRPNNNAVIAIVGDITVNEIKEHIIPMIGNWASGKIDESSVPSKFAEGPLTVTEHMPISQANIVMGHRGIERGNPDYYSVLAMNHILGGGGLGSRLMRKIRIEKGLAYSVSSNFDAGKRSGIFQVSVQTHTAAANRAVSTIINEMESMQKNPVSNEELATAKKYLVGSFPLKLTTQSGVASLVAQMEYFNLGMDYPERLPSLIGSVTVEDVIADAKSYLYPEKVILSIAADMDELTVEELIFNYDEKKKPGENQKGAAHTD